MYKLFMLHCFYLVHMKPVVYNWENNLNNTRFIDLTNRCFNSTMIKFFVPFGVGVADAVVLLVAQPEQDVLPKCNVTFSIIQEDENTDLLILVIEFLNRLISFDELVSDCRGDINGTGTLLVKSIDPPGRFINVCDQLVRSRIGSSIFVQVFFSKQIQLQLRSSFIAHSMKLTVTTGKALERHAFCNESYQAQCVIGKLSICINKALSCDRNINCGVLDRFDEDKKVCAVEKNINISAVVFASEALGFLLFLIAFFLFRSCVQKKTGNFFIFDEDEDNKLIIKSQLGTPGWQKLRPLPEDIHCICQITSDTNSYSVTSIDD